MSESKGSGRAVDAPSGAGRVPQAGGLVVRDDDDRVAVLLVRAKKDPRVWVFPKGHIEPGESAAEAAVREVEEEAGVVAELLGPIGAPQEFQSGKEQVSVQYFLMRARSESPSSEGREKRWFPVDEALRALSFEDARQLVRDAQSALAGRPAR
jgi:ADP-ribose pyrophosphatase YjhB (NUDIX family)